MNLNSQKSYRGIFIFFIMVTLALIVFVLYTSFSQAIITLNPKKDKISLDFEIKIGKEAKLDSEPKILEGEILQTTETVNEKITDFPKTKQEDRAKGKVTIYNNMEQSQGIVAKTQLKHDKTGLIFRTDEMINLPPRNKVEVSVTADKIGPEGEIEPGKFKLIKLSGDLQNSIYGESKEKFKIVQKEVKIASAEIMEKEKQKIADNLTQKGLANLEKKLEDNKKIVNGAIKQEIIDSKTSVEPETETEEFSIYLKLKLTALAFDEKALYDIAELKLKQKTTKEQEYQKVFSESIKYEIKNYDLSRNEAEIKIHIEGEAMAKLKTEDIDKEKLLGRSEEEVKMYFKNDPRIESIEVLFSPFWTKRVPTLKDHIEIVVKK